MLNKVIIFVATLVCLPLVSSTPLKLSQSEEDFRNNVFLPYTDEEERIIGGSQARAGQFPYAVAIYVKTLISNFFCGGALLSTEWVITTGHCVDSATELEITVGSNTLTENDPNRITVVTSTYHVHPDFDMNTLDNDLGLVHLREAIQFSDYISQIYLPVTPYGSNVEVIAIGWGQTDDVTPGPVEHLNYVNVVTITNEECKVFFGDQIIDHMICVSGPFQEGICTGDSGDPLVYLLNNRHPIVIGLASFHSGATCEGPEPSGYIRVFEYRDWILNITGNLF